VPSSIRHHARIPVPAMQVPCMDCALSGLTICSRKIIILLSLDGKDRDHEGDPSHHHKMHVTWFYEALASRQLLRHQYISFEQYPALLEGQAHGKS
jgi:hypothetical protein